MRRFLPWVLCIGLLSIAGCAHEKAAGVVFQTSTINALLQGAYDGDMTFAELRKHGDFGIGTFDRLDGEMVGLDGTFYQVKSDGSAYLVDDATKTPFAVVTFFEPERTVALDRVLTCRELEEYIDSLLPTQNIFFAVRVDGRFGFVRTRSVPAQEKPYPLLVEVVKQQGVFDFREAEGTLIGFRSPSYTEGVQVPGYHLHFLTRKRDAGGHLLDCSATKVSISIASGNTFLMSLPKGGDFYHLDLSKKDRRQLDSVEKQGGGR